MKDYKILKFLDIFKRFFNKLGVDYESMRKILQVKLLLDARRESTVNLNNMNQNKESDKDKNQFLRGLPIYLLFGLVFIFFVIVDGNYLFTMGSAFGLFMFFMTITLVSDFSSVLLDVRDKSIILTKPVDSMTVNIARIIHIIIYVTFITVAIILPSLIASLFTKSISFVLLYIFNIILIDLFIIVFTALLYLSILKFFDGEKLKDIINYVQIGLTILSTISYQFMGRLFDVSQLLEIQFSPTWWSVLLPPIWFASSFELLFGDNKQTIIIFYSALSILIPIISIIAYVKLIPAFERNLQKLNEEDSNTKRRNELTHKIGNLICRTNEEKTFFNFSANLMKSERNFKLRVYPNLGFSMVFPLIMMFGLDSRHILPIYFVGIAFTQLFQLTKYSDGYKGAWVYEFFSLDESTVYKATLKSIFVKLVTPMFLFLSLSSILIIRKNILLDLIIVYIALYIGLYLSFKISKKTLPFSQEFGAIKEKGGLLEVFLLFLIMGLLTLIHYVSGIVIYGKYIYLILLVVGILAIDKYGFKTKNIDYSI